MKRIPILLMLAQAVLSAVVFYDDLISFTWSFPLLLLLINWPLFALCGLVLVAGVPQGTVARHALIGSLGLSFTVSLVLHILALPFAWKNGGHLGDASLLLLGAPVLAAAVAALGAGLGAVVSVLGSNRGGLHGA